MEEETFDLALTDRELQLIRSALSAEQHKYERLKTEETDYQREHYFRQMEISYSNLAGRLGMLHLERMRIMREAVK